MGLQATAYAHITGIKTVGDPCATRTLALQAEGRSNSPYFTWNFGDPASGKNDTVTVSGGSDVPFPTYTFSANGKYVVCVSFQEPGFPVSTVCDTIFIGLCCSGIMEATDGCLENNIFFSVITGAPVITIAWDFDDPASESFNTSNRLEPDHRFSVPGTYTVRATINAPCSPFVVSGEFVVESCEVPDTCTALITLRDTCLASGTLFQLASTSTLFTVQWDFGDAASGTDNFSTNPRSAHQFNTPGLYQVKAYLSLTCGLDTVVQAVPIVDGNIPPSPNCRVILPNAFSPNADGRNDCFGAIIFGTCTLDQYELKIFNRWGQVVYKATNVSGQWDGLTGLKESPTGVYAYTVSYRFRGGQKHAAGGRVMLIR